MESSALSTRRGEPGTPLYVHAPFCVVKCSYCDFYSLVAEGHDLEAAVDALLAEAQGFAPPEPRTVFIGGGTPSLFSAPQLERLLRGLDERTGFRASAEEVTVECNPESLDLEKARALRELGVDRLSIGLQSLRPEILRLFERPHDVKAGLSAFAVARAAGFARVSVDLIYAVPGQRLAEWEGDLDLILALGPDHVSAYGLTFEPGTRLGQDLAEGRVERLSEEDELAFLTHTRARLARAGLPGYEVSNFSPKHQQCAHNVNYWRNGEYAGIGPSAVSSVGGTRFGNPRSFAQWQCAALEGRAASAWSETLAPERRLAETWWLGLRLLEGVDPAEARAISGCPVRADRSAPLVADLLEQGWLEERRGRVALSERGLPLGDAIAARFLALPEGGAEARSSPTLAARPMALAGAAHPAPAVPTRLEHLVGGRVGGRVGGASRP